MSKHRIAIISAVLLAAAGLVWAQASDPATPSQPTGVMAGSMMGGSMMGGSSMMDSLLRAFGSMMGDQETMMAQGQDAMRQIQAMDDTLDTLVAAMNDARGEQKVDAIAAVVTELVAQRQAMNQTLASMQPGTMMQMAQHMPMAHMHGAGSAMYRSPTGGDPPAPDHASHH